MARRLLLVDARSAGPPGLDRVRARGVTVASAPSVEGALQLARRGRRRGRSHHDDYDAVLVATAGIHVTVPMLDALAAEVPRVVLVVREGEASPAERAVLEADAYPFLFEPIDPDQLEAEIATGRPGADLRPSLSA